MDRNLQSTIDRFVMVADNGSFEETLTGLDESLALLESGDLTLDETVAVYSAGMRIAQRAQALIDAAELKIEEIQQSQSQ